MFFAVLLLLFAAANTQPVTAPLGDNATITVFPVASLQPYQLPSSPYYPNDFYVATQISPNFIFTLASNNVV